jgi:hypothetical protein
VGEAVNLVLFIYGLAFVIAMLAAFLIKGIVGALSLADRRAAAAPAAAQPVPAVAATQASTVQDDIVAIAAAVQAVLGAHRIVRIEGAATGFAWAAEGRMVHHTSHRPTPRR